MRVGVIGAGYVGLVTAAGLAVQNTFLQYEAAQRSRAASEQNVAAELARFGVGVATNFEVVTAQNQLTTARLSELQALINHLTAVADFERVLADEVRAQHEVLEHRHYDQRQERH